MENDLYALMTAHVEVEVVRMCDVVVDAGAGLDIGSARPLITE